MSDPATVLLLERVLVELQGLRSDFVAFKQMLTVANDDRESGGFLTVPQAAKFLGMSESWVYQRSAAGELPCVRIGRALRFDPTALRAYTQGGWPAAGRILPMRSKGA